MAGTHLRLLQVLIVVIKEAGAGVPRLLPGAARGHHALRRRSRLPRQLLEARLHTELMLLRRRHGVLLLLLRSCLLLGFFGSRGRRRRSRLPLLLCRRRGTRFGTRGGSGAACKVGFIVKITRQALQTGAEGATG